MVFFCIGDVGTSDLDSFKKVVAVFTWIALLRYPFIIASEYTKVMHDRVKRGEKKLTERTFLKSGTQAFRVGKQPSVREINKHFVTI